MGPGRAGMAPTSGPGWARNAGKQSTWRIWTWPLGTRDGTWTGPGSDPGEGLDGTPRDSNRLLGLSELGVGVEIWSSRKPLNLLVTSQSAPCICVMCSLARASEHWSKGCPLPRILCIVTQACGYAIRCVIPDLPVLPFLGLSCKQSPSNGYGIIYGRARRAFLRNLDLFLLIFFSSFS